MELRKRKSWSLVLEMEQDIIDELIEKFSKKEEMLSSGHNSLKKEIEKISSDPFKTIYFNLEKIIPKQIEGLILMDRLNLLVGIKQHLLGIKTEKTHNLFKNAISSTSNNWNLTKENLSNVKKIVECLEREINKKRK